MKFLTARRRTSDIYSRTTAEDQCEAERSFLLSSIACSERVLNVCIETLNRLQKNFDGERGRMTPQEYATAKAEIDQASDRKSEEESKLNRARATLSRMDSFQADRRRKAEACRALVDVQARFKTKQSEYDGLLAQMDHMRRFELPKVGHELQELMRQLAAAKEASQIVASIVEEPEILEVVNG